MPRICRSAPVITTAPIRCMSRIFTASPSVAVGLSVTTSWPLRDRIALTVMGILPRCGRPSTEKLELHLGAPLEPFDLGVLFIGSQNTALTALILIKGERLEGLQCPFWVIGGHFTMALTITMASGT